MLFDHQCARPAGRRYLVVSIDTDSGVRSHKAFRAKMLARLPVCRRQLVAGGSEKEAGMPTIQFTPLSGRYLSFAEREEIAILRAQEFGVRAICPKLGRAPSTISRELRRNAATRSGGFNYVRRRHSGTQTDVHDDRRLRSSPRTRRYVPGYRNASRAASVRRMVFR